MSAPNPTPDRAATLRLAFTADLASARSAAAAVRDFLSEQGVTDAERFACELCAAEACNNAVEYAGETAKRRGVILDAACTVGQIELRVSDHTQGFEWPPEKSKQPARAERGRGLFIMHAYMDEVLYLRGDYENALVLRKKRALQPKAGAPDAPGLGDGEPCGHSRVFMGPDVPLAHELAIARVIQRSLLPVTLPQMPGFGIAGAWHCAREVGGDFYDTIPLAEDVTLLLVADVMGKGIPAALFATHLRGLLRGLSARLDDPAQLLGRLNRLLHDELSAAGMFITAQVAIVDVRARTITVASAGHGPLLYRAASGEIQTLSTEGLPLGVLPDVTYHARTVVFGAPGVLLMHTDGLTDVRNGVSEPFGESRLAQWLQANCVPGRSATQIRGRLSAELARFRGTAAMLDDQAFLLLVEETSPEASAVEAPARLPVSLRRAVIHP